MTLLVYGFINASSLHGWTKPATIASFVGRRGRC